MRDAAAGAVAVEGDRAVVPLIRIGQAALDPARLDEGEAWCAEAVLGRGLTEPVLHLNLAAFRIKRGDLPGAREVLARLGGPRTAAMWAQWGDGSPLEDPQ